MATFLVNGKSSVSLSDDKKTATHVIGNGNVIHYYLFNGVYYSLDTPKEVAVAIDAAKLYGHRVRLHYGHTEADHPKRGLDWMEEHNVEGRISNTMGPLKVPIILASSRSLGGPAILDHCIVKITMAKGKYVLYQHHKYHRPEITVQPVTWHGSEGDLKLKGYTHAVCYDGNVAAIFKTLNAANRFVAKMT